MHFVKFRRRQTTRATKFKITRKIIEVLENINFFHYDTATIDQHSSRQHKYPVFKIE
jgi:hypothetical protein